jgi:hypothetical protein
MGLIGPGGVNRECFFADLAGTDAGVDTWSCPLTLVSGAANGEWTAYVRVYGLTTEQWDATELATAGFSSSLTVSGGGPVETTAPVLTGLTVLTPVVAHGDDFSYQVTLTDAGSGVAAAGVFVQTSMGIVYLNGTCWSHTLSSGTPASGTFVCTSLAGAPLPVGEYTVAYVLIYDRAGNGDVLDAAELTDLGFTGTGFVIN